MDGTNLTDDGPANFIVNLQATIGGEQVDLGDTPFNFPANPVAAATYTCSGDTLTTYPLIPGMTVSPIIYSRTGP